MGGVVGLEIAPSRAAMVLVRAGRHGAIVERFAWIEGLSGVPELTARLTELRREHRLPGRACLVAWGGGERAQALASSARRAGFRIETLLSPSEAMVAAANPRIAQTALKVGPTAYLSLHADGGHVAVAIGSRIVMERQIRLSYPTLQSTAMRQRLLHRYTVLAAIVTVLEPAFREVKRVHGKPVRQIVTCGSLPELRSLTMPLAEEFDVEVETLDGIDDVDATRLPTPAESFRDRAAALRLALTAAEKVSGPSFSAPLIAATSLALAALLAWLALASRETTGSRLAAGPPAPPLAPAATDVAPAAPGAAGTIGRAESAGAPRLRLQAIRSSRGRRVAVINGRIVGAGDRIDGVTVFDVGSSVVVVRDGSGRLYTVTR